MSKYRVLSSADVPDWLSEAGLSGRLGGGPADWRVTDVADGNLNSVFLVDGPAGALCVKQSLPYVRVAKESWPLDVERARFEAAYAARVAPFVGKLAPRFHHFDADQRAIAMEVLRPHIILRTAFVAGQHFPRVAKDVAEYVAECAVMTSDLAAPFEARAKDLATFSQNLALQRITVDLVFIDPYMIHERNRILPSLQPWAAHLRQDERIKAAVAQLRFAYLTKAQSLLHGDLHTGSIMATEADTKVIDGEFAWVGPTGFDVGNFLAHLVIAWFARPFQTNDPECVANFRGEIESDVVTFWEIFRQRFFEIASREAAGDGLPRAHFADRTGSLQRNDLVEAYADDVLDDAIGFLAVELVRRIIGFAQVADFLSIADPKAQALAKARALALARTLLVEREAFRDPESLLAAMRAFDNAGLDPSERPRKATRTGGAA